MKRFVVLDHTDPIQAAMHLRHHLRASHGTQASQSRQKRADVSPGDWDALRGDLKGDDDGFSLHDTVGDLPDYGYMVSTDQASEQTYDLASLTAQDLEDYYAAHKSLIDQPHKFMGAWVDDGKCYLDVSTWLPDKEAALDLGAKYDQLSIFDLANMTSIPCDSQRRQQQAAASIQHRLTSGAKYVHITHTGNESGQAGVSIGNDWLSGINAIRAAENLPPLAPDSPAAKVIRTAIETPFKRGTDE